MVNKIAITQPFPLTNGGQSNLANGETSARNGGGNPVGINPKGQIKTLERRKTMIGIYKITNKINGKCYIGQSNDIERRWREHKSAFDNPNASDYESKKNRAFRKYGIENFDFQVLEEVSLEMLNDREIYWISYFNSVEDGYNTSYGGQGPNLKGENHSQAKNNKEVVNRLKYMLEHSNISYDKLSEIFGISKAEISNINNGKNWVDENLIYPLRKNGLARIGENNGTSKFLDKEVVLMRQLYQFKTISEIQDLYKGKASKSAIKQILTGETYKHLPVYKKTLKKWIEACID